MSGGVCGMSVGCLGGVRGYLSGIHRKRRRLDVFGGYLGSQSLRYGAKTPFWHSTKRHNYFHLTILRHQHTKTAVVTVAFDHPVSCLLYICLLAPSGALIVMMVYYISAAAAAQLFQILSIYAFLYCYKCHSKSLEQYQCN